MFHCAPENSAVYQIAKAVADGIEDRPDISILRPPSTSTAGDTPRPTRCSPKSGLPFQKKTSTVLLLLCPGCFWTGQFDRYLELLDEAIQLDPASYESTLVDAYLRVADQANQAGELPRYIKYLAAAVAESPQTASLHVKLGDAYEGSPANSTRRSPNGKWSSTWRATTPQRMKLLNLIKKYRTRPRIPLPRRTSGHPG